MGHRTNNPANRDVDELGDLRRVSTNPQKPALTTRVSGRSRAGVRKTDQPARLRGALNGQVLADIQPASLTHSRTTRPNSDDAASATIRRMVFARSALAVASVLTATLTASPAAAAIPCSKSAVAKIVHVDTQRQEAITDLRCADLTGDGRRDAAWTKFAGGSGGALSWGIVYEHNGRKVARFHGHSRYYNLRIRGRRVLVDSPIYRPGDVNANPTGGTRIESATWNGRRFVKRLVFVRRTA